MKKWIAMSAACTLVFAFTLTAHADPGGKGKGDAAKGDRKGPAARGQKDGPRKGRPQFDRAALMKKFDTDQSGDLNEEEKAALKKHFAEMRAKRGEQGKGRPGRPQIDRAKILAEFDKDEDGRLNEEERAAAKEAMMKRFREARGGKGGPQGKGPQGKGPRGEGRPGPRKLGPPEKKKD